MRIIFLSDGWTIGLCFIIWPVIQFLAKNLENFSKETLNRFLIESARAELTHLLAILHFWIFCLFTPQRVIWYMLIYSLVVNLPCIIVQRYNRPRVLRFLKKMRKNEFIQFTTHIPQN